MAFKAPLILGVAGIALLAGCVQNPYQYDDPNARTKGGALTGALIGATIGATSGGDDRLAKAVIGGAIGAAAGGAIGSSLDAQAAELRQQLGGNASVVNNGDRINVTMGQDILFATDSFMVRPDQQYNLQAIGQNLVRYPNSRIEIVGHTDSDGEAAYNQSLSERRAVAVRDVLMASGVPAGRLSAYGRGEEQPVASNLTAAGKQQNRRVEIIIVPTR
ncbi:membrane protein [Gemmobacter lanyuensis]|uniref:Membrane protein n=1 Tax=Gemmobacter lanyuensis TaxID=1054497 RepID=A0A918IVP9_9RHOB|nr:OmpA family protein [Gemmobacter lanyuensis]GGW33130.1 membrane protein [Gemmobacter lanyuensis]